MFTDLPTICGTNVYIAIVIALAVGWLLRHRGIGKTMLPSVAGDAPTKPKADAVPAVAASPALADIEKMIQAKFAEAAGVDPTVKAKSEMAVLSQMMLDHPGQQGAIMAIVASLAAEATKKPAAA